MWFILNVIKSDLFGSNKCIVGGVHIVSVTPWAFVKSPVSNTFWHLISLCSFDVEPFLCHLVGANEKNAGGSMSFCKLTHSHTHTHISLRSAKPKESNSMLRTPKRNAEKLSDRVKLTIDWLLPQRERLSGEKKMITLNSSSTVLYSWRVETTH